MAELSPAKGLGLSDRSVAVALITMGRYLADKDPGFARYLAGSLKHAQSSSLPDTDLAALRLVLNAVGGG